MVWMKYGGTFMVILRQALGRKDAWENFSVPLVFLHHITDFTKDAGLSEQDSVAVDAAAEENLGMG